MKSLKVAWYSVPRSARKAVGIALTLGFGMTIGYIAGIFFLKLLFSLIILAERLMNALFRAILF
ncbi:hypothetical protein [uncultured Peptoniphilus sp.]|uniref:hypothetical protein n=1 Tax=uncultured Peptoniphilus sp. TaxID=254354 RepID=UPI0028044118|nr:hypothetical protein [uncultured Peptoniphilus sp.]